MLRWLRAPMRFFQSTIGWNRVGVLLSLSIIAIAMVVLFHMLRNLDIGQVLAAMKATKRSHVAAAALFVACGYYTLTFYDWFALRTIGRNEVPYRIAALSGFTSYAIGHNIGASIFSSGAVRYRIYSAYGLSAIEVARLCFVAGLTFWLGNATVLGLGVIFEPNAAGAIDLLPAWGNRIVAVMTLLTLVSYVGWVWSAPREIGQGNWKVNLPSGPSTLVQIVIGLFDLGFCTLAMYMLLPSEPHVGFATLLVVFVTATMLGFASYAPGGLGVFDAAMLVALWEFDKEDLIAGLLLFRVLYYLVPFVIALAIMGTREVFFVRGTKVLPRHETSSSPSLDAKRESEKTDAG